MKKWTLILLTVFCANLAIAQHNDDVLHNSHLSQNEISNIMQMMHLIQLHNMSDLQRKLSLETRSNERQATLLELQSLSRSWSQQTHIQSALVNQIAAGVVSSSGIKMDNEVTLKLKGTGSKETTIVLDMKRRTGDYTIVSVKGN